MKEIKLKNSQLVAIVDDEDYERINQYQWQLSPKGYIIRYTGGAYSRKQLRMHNEVLNMPANSGVDHKDRNKWNNTKENLRLVSRSVNQQNRSQINNTSGYKGVTFTKRGKARANIGFEGQLIHLGLFDDPRDAAKAYDKKARELYGIDALTNFPLVMEVQS